MSPKSHLAWREAHRRRQSRSRRRSSRPLTFRALQLALRKNGMRRGRSERATADGRADGWEWESSPSPISSPRLFLRLLLVLVKQEAAVISQVSSTRRACTEGAHQLGLASVPARTSCRGPCVPSVVVVHALTVRRRCFSSVVIVRRALEGHPAGLEILVRGGELIEGVRCL